MPQLKVRYVGLDVHKDSITLAVAEAGRDPARHVETIPADFHSLQKRLRRLAKGYRLQLCYEAGPTGFELYRRLTEAGYACEVIAPSLIPTKPGQRIKTDRRDAVHLAACLRSGDLTAVRVPDAETEALRDLERARTAAKAAELTAKHQLGKFLLRHGRTWTKSNWTRSHLAWVRRQQFEQEAQQRVLRDYLNALEAATERVAELTRDIEELIAQSTLAPLAIALQAMRGIATISAVIIAAEIGDLRRFRTAKAFMAFVGLVPSESSSGQRTQRGSITKTGNRHVRRILVEAAWHAFRAAQTSKALRARRAKVSDPVARIAEKAQRRLARKFYRLVYEKGKSPQVAVVAVARELAGFLWAIGQQEQLLASDGPALGAHPQRPPQAGEPSLSPRRQSPAAGERPTSGSDEGPPAGRRRMKKTKMKAKSNVEQPSPSTPATGSELEPSRGKTPRRQTAKRGKMESHSKTTSKSSKTTSKSKARSHAEAKSHSETTSNGKTKSVSETNEHREISSRQTKQPTRRASRTGIGNGSRTQAGGARGSSG